MEQRKDETGAEGQRAIVALFADGPAMKRVASRLLEAGFAPQALGYVAPGAEAPWEIASTRPVHVQASGGQRLVAGGSALPAVTAAAPTAPERLLPTLVTQLDPPPSGMSPDIFFLWVSVTDGEQERLARELLARHAAISVHLHRLRTARAGEDPVAGIEPDPFLPGARI